MIIKYTNHVENWVLKYWNIILTFEYTICGKNNPILKTTVKYYTSKMMVFRYSKYKVMVFLILYQIWKILEDWLLLLNVKLRRRKYIMSKWDYRIYSIKCMYKKYYNLSNILVLTEICIWKKREKNDTIRMYVLTATTCIYANGIITVAADTKFATLNIAQIRLKYTPYY